MRLFTASSFNPGFVENLKAIADYARANSEAGAVNFSAPENYHLTYAFLGNTDQPGAAAAIKGLEAGLDGLKAFRISSGGFGVFPVQGRPAVLWVGIDEGAAELKSLAGKLAEGLAAAGLVFERRFEPHVTLGRVKGPLPVDFAGRLARFTQARRGSLSALASVELVESLPCSAGQTYRRVHSRRLL